MEVFPAATNMLRIVLITPEPPAAVGMRSSRLLAESRKMLSWNTVPPLHTEYLLRQVERGERALAFVFIPHVLVDSAIDVSGLAPQNFADA